MWRFRCICFARRPMAPSWSSTSMIIGEVEFVCKRDVGSPSMFTLPIMLVAIAEDGSGAAPAFIRKGEGGVRLTPVH